MHVALAQSTSATAHTIQGALQSGSRILLMIAMALFLAYVLFFLSTVSIASALTMWHSIHRRQPQAEAAPTEVTRSLPRSADRSRERTGSHGRHVAEAVN